MNNLDYIKLSNTVIGIAKEAVAAGSGSAPGQDKVLVKLTLGTVGTS